MERPGGRGQGREKWRIKRNSKNLRINPEAPNRQILGKYGLICENSREMFISFDHCIIHASADRGGPAIKRIYSHYGVHTAQLWDA